MYFPEKSMWNRNGSPDAYSKADRKKRFYGITGALVILALLLSALLLSKGGFNEQTAAQSLRHDLAKLWSWSDKVYLDGAIRADWQVNWHIESTGADNVDKLAAVLFQDSKGNSSDKTVTNDGNSIQGSVNRLGGQLSIHVMGGTETKVALMIVLERSSDNGEELELFLASVDEISQQIRKTGSRFEASVKAHGFTIDKDAAKQLQRLAQGRLLEEYDEGGTRSLTYHSSGLRSSKPLSPGRSASLQIVVHKGTEHALTELTIGTPVLTGEFGAKIEER